MLGSVSEPVLDFPSALILNNSVKAFESQNILLTALKKILKNILKGLTTHKANNFLCFFIIGIHKSTFFPIEEKKVKAQRNKNNEPNT